ncbi:MAG: MerR family transcriptional regulator [Vampirovibrionales bacterium]|nr:MerR family transcriptional regulator [Vampirovibrionales bacterium]
MTTLKSGDVAKKAGVHSETLRYYEREGLLPTPERSEAAYRLYPPETVDRVLFIKRAQDIGFTLKEIRQLLHLKFDVGEPCAEIKHMTADKIAVVDEKIQLLQVMKTMLIELHDACPGEGPAGCCPILHHLNDD